MSNSKWLTRTLRGIASDLPPNAVLLILIDEYKHTYGWFVFGDKQKSNFESRATAAGGHCGMECSLTRDLAAILCSWADWKEVGRG